MDFSQIFSNFQNKDISNQSFEDKVTASTQSSGENAQNQTQQNNMFEKLLPLLTNGTRMDSNSLLQMFGNSNPQMNGLMSILPMLKNFQKSPSQKKQSKKKFEYVKVTDYYKK